MCVLACDKDALEFLIGKTVINYEIIEWNGEKGINEPYCFALHFDSGNRLFVRPFYDKDGSYLAVELDDDI